MLLLGHINILEWGAKRNPPILPTWRGMNMAFKNGHINILEWGAKRNPPILPTWRGMNMAFKNGHINILEWGTERNILSDELFGVLGW